MVKADIITLLTNSIGGIGSSCRLDNDDMERALRVALRALEKTRPYYKDGSITLAADQEFYQPPTGFVDIDHSSWGRGKKSYMHGCGLRPKILRIRERIQFSPAPTTKQICIWGAQFNFIYTAEHVLTDVESDTTLLDEDEGLLLLRGTAELMQILASKNVVSPIQLHKGIGNVPTSGTPGFMFKSLMAEYLHQASGRKQ